MIWDRVTTMDRTLSLSKNGVDHNKTMTRWAMQMVEAMTMKRTNSGSHVYAKITLAEQEVVQVSSAHQGSNEDNINFFHI